jgi:uncharacterized coiled-coil protein SlyX
MRRLSRFLLLVFGVGGCLVLLGGVYEYSLLKRIKTVAPNRAAQAQTIPTIVDPVAVQQVSSNQLETRRLSERVASLTREVDGLRNSFVDSQQPPKPPTAKS